MTGRGLRPAGQQAGEARLDRRIEMKSQNVPALPPSSHASDAHDDEACPRRRRRGFLAGLLLGVVGAGLIGFGIGAAMPVADAAMGRMARRGMGHGPDGPPSVEDMKDHAEFFVGFALHRLDATPDQEAQVQKTIDGAIEQLYPIVEKHRANRDELHSVLKAATIDRAAIEKLRVEEVALADSFSKVIASAIGDTAEALTAEQRAELMDRLESFRHHP
jgi:Spy/CpxP family protein refolding chaperone